jgi:membrane protein YdbS with pleckstrin-like domain
MGYVERMLGEHEKIVLITHQHWMVLASSFLQNLVLVLVILVIALLAWTTPSPIAPFGWLIALLVVVPAARFVYHFMLWDNREYVVTNRRVIKLSGLLNKNVFDSALEKVNDVEMAQSLLGRLFDYGDVEIMTAAEEGENLFRRIAHPVKFKTAMLNQKEAMGGDEGIPAGAPGAAPTAMNVPALIAGLDQLRKQGLITEEEFQQKKQELLSRI